MIRNKLKARLTKLICFTLVLLYSILATSSITKAAQSNNTGLEISPLRTYPNIKRGESSTGTVMITNHSDHDAVVKLSTETFSVVNENYDYKLATSDELGWVKFIQNSVKLTAHKSTTIPYALQIPNDASPGGHYFALIASESVQSDSTSINELRRVASLIYLEVGGNITKKSQLLSFKLPWLSTRQEIATDYRLNNQGNSHVRSRVEIGYKLLPTGISDILVQSEHLFLPHTVRRLTANVNLPNIPGIYRVSVKYSPPQGGSQTISHTLVYLPVWSILMFIVLVSWLAWELWLVMHKRHKN